MSTSSPVQVTPYIWWEQRRFKYNLGLIIAGITAFVLYAVSATYLIMPYNDYFEITLFTTAAQGIGYLFMMLVANVFYYMGFIADRLFNKNNSETFRHRLFNIGFWFSMSLPFLIPVMVIVQYLVYYA